MLDAEPLEFQPLEPLELALCEPATLKLDDELRSSVELNVPSRELEPLAEVVMVIVSTVGAVCAVVHSQAWAVLVGGSSGSGVTQWGTRVGDGHGVFLLVEVATGNVDADVALSPAGRALITAEDWVE